MPPADYEIVPNEAAEDDHGDKYLSHPPRRRRVVPILVVIICIQTVALVAVLFRKPVSKPALARLYCVSSSILDPVSASVLNELALLSACATFG
jgi:hypothetical protein